MIGLVLFCTDAKFCKKIFIGRLSKRSTRFKCFSTTETSIFQQIFVKICQFLMPSSHILASVVRSLHTTDNPTKNFGVCGAKPSHHTPQALAFRFDGVCLCTKELTFFDAVATRHFLQFVALFCNVSYNFLQYFGIFYNILQYFCNILQYFAIFCNILQYFAIIYFTIFCNILQYFAKFCNILQCLQ